MPTAIIYATKGGASASQLYTIDPFTGAQTAIGNTGYAITGLAFDPTSGLLYAVSTNNSPIHTNALLTLNTTTGAPTFIATMVYGGPGSMTGIPDITFDSDGTLYGWASFPPQRLVTINKITAAVTSVGPSGLFSSYGNGLTFAGSSLYVAPEGGPISSPTGFQSILFSVDKTTGALTPGPTMTGSPYSNGPPVAAMAADSGGTIWAILNHGVDCALVTINPSTGEVSAGSFIAAGFDGLALSTGDPPTPSSGPPLVVFDGAEDWRVTLDGITDTVYDGGGPAGGIPNPIHPGPGGQGGGGTGGSGQGGAPPPSSVIYSGAGLYRVDGTLADTSPSTVANYQMVVGDIETDASVFVSFALPNNIFTFIRIQLGTGSSPEWVDPTSDPASFLVDLFNYPLASYPSIKGVLFEHVDAANDTDVIPFLSYVGPQLKAAGYQVMFNVSAVGAPSYGDEDDASADIAWINAIGPYATHILMGYWQQARTGVDIGLIRHRGSASYSDYWDEWQQVPVAAHSVGCKFVGLSYAGSVGVSNAIYCRASLLLETANGDTFMFLNGAEDPSWQMKVGNPVDVAGTNPRRFTQYVATVDPDAGVASIERAVVTGGGGGGTPGTGKAGVGAYQFGSLYDPSLVPEYNLMNMIAVGIDNAQAPTQFSNTVRSLLYRSVLSVNSGYDTSIDWGLANSLNLLARDSGGGLLYNTGYPSNNIIDITSTQSSSLMGSHFVDLCRQYGFSGVIGDDVVANALALLNAMPAGVDASLWYTLVLAHTRRIAAYMLAAGLEFVLNANYYDSSFGDSTDNGDLDVIFWTDLGASASGDEAPPSGLSAEYWMQDPSNESVVRTLGASYNQHWDGWRRLHPLCHSMSIDFMPSPHTSADSSGCIYERATFLLDYNRDGSVMLIAPTTYDPYGPTWCADMGDALGDATETSSGIWERSFTNGDIMVNANSGTATIS